MRWLFGVLVASMIGLTQSVPANALKIEIEHIEDSHFLVTLSDIEDVEGRVFTVDRATGEVIFDDGASGAIPPTGQSVIASYRYGSGSEGNILEVFPLTADFLELSIPTAQMSDDDYSFVLSGIRSLEFDVSPTGISVVAADITPIPEPSTLLLLGIGLFGIVTLGRKFQG